MFSSNHVSVICNSLLASENLHLEHVKITTLQILENKLPLGYDSNCTQRTGSLKGIGSALGLGELEI